MACTLADDANDGLQYYNELAPKQNTRTRAQISLAARAAPWSQPASDQASDDGGRGLGALRRRGLLFEYSLPLSKPSASSLARPAFASRAAFRSIVVLCRPCVPLMLHVGGSQQSGSDLRCHRLVEWHVRNGPRGPWAAALPMAAATPLDRECYRPAPEKDTRSR